MKFGLSDLRRLSKVDPIDIKPITLLVGRNSGGKSTYLRSLPLIRQSLQTRTSSPILWFGDLVDFGSFDESLSKFTGEETVSFSFVDSEISYEEGQYYYSNEFGYIGTINTRISYKNVSYQVYISKLQEKNRISRVKINLDHDLHEIDLIINEQNHITEIKINGVSIIGLLGGQRLSILNGSLFPEVRFQKNKPQSDSSFP